MFAMHILLRFRHTTKRAWTPSGSHIAKDESLKPWLTRVVSLRSESTRERRERHAGAHRGQGVFRDTCVLLMVAVIALGG
jgi:hypothetical protein